MQNRMTDRRRDRAACGLKGSRKKRRYLVCFILIWAVQMAAAFYFCTQKAGFHEDEYYTYYSTARTIGFYVEDGKWMDAETYRNEFVVLPGQQFQYGLVRLVQSWDVHPPVYYWIFHTVASLAPGVFSKWIGLGINLFIHGINLILLTYLSYLMCGKDRKPALAVTLFYGLTPAAISGVVFIRMYELLTMFVLLCAIVHMRAVCEIRTAGAQEAAKQETEAERKRGILGSGIPGEGKLTVFRYLLPMAAVTYLGFLTQYYYFIFLFYLAIAFCVYLLWHDRNLWNCLRYGLSQAAAFVLAYLTYPSCLGQMFRGQRGAQATENFFDLSNTVMRFSFFYELLDEYVFGKLLAGFWLAVVVLFLLLRFRKKSGRVFPQGRQTVGEKAQEAGTAKGPAEMLRTSERSETPERPEPMPWQMSAILGFAVIGYFLTVSKTALLLGDTSNRYQLPVYGMIVLMLFGGICRMWKQCMPRGEWSKYLPAVAAVLCLVIDFTGLMSGRVVFLYPEDREQVAFARQQAQAGTPVVYLYNEGADWCIWDVTNELLEYDRVYFATAGKEEPLADDAIATASSLVVYVADGADAQAQIERIMAGNEKLTEYRLAYEEKYCDVYYFYESKKAD